MKISVRVARMSQRKPHGAKTTWLRPVKMFAHMGLHTEVPFLYRTHINTVIHLKHTVCCDTHLHISGVRFYSILYSQEK
jgi:hypothetical protein